MIMVMKKAWDLEYGELEDEELDVTPGSTIWYLTMATHLDCVCNFWNRDNKTPLQSSDSLINFQEKIEKM